MSEQIELEIPKLINKDWIAGFNKNYSRGEFLAKMVIEEWLEQPENLCLETNYYSLEDKQNTLPPRNWKHSVVGKIISAEFTHTPKVGGEMEGYGLFMSRSFLESKNSRDLIADGRLIFVRFDNILNQKLVLFKDITKAETIPQTTEKYSSPLKQVA